MSVCHGPDTMLGTSYLTSHLVFVNLVQVRHHYSLTSGKNTGVWKVNYLSIATQLVKGEAEGDAGLETI